MTMEIAAPPWGEPSTANPNRKAKIEAASVWLWSAYLDAGQVGGWPDHPFPFRAPRAAFALQNGDFAMDVDDIHIDRSRGMVCLPGRLEGPPPGHILIRGKASGLGDAAKDAFLAVEVFVEGMRMHR